MEEEEEKPGSSTLFTRKSGMMFKYKLKLTGSILIQLTQWCNVDCDDYCMQTVLEGKRLDLTLKTLFLPKHIY